MKRPVLVTITAAAQTLAAAVLIFVAASAFVASRGAGKPAGFDPAAIAALGALAVLTLISSVGLWLAKAWGWAFAVLSDATGLVIFLWDPVQRRVRPGIDDLSFIIGFVVLHFLLLLTPVRRFLLRKQEGSN